LNISVNAFSSFFSFFSGLSERTSLAVPRQMALVQTERNPKGAGIMA
jgi:hypothetical protein